jgi:hypothetical protein
MSDEAEGRGSALSRRALLRKALGALGAAAVIPAQAGPAAAVIKISQAAVAYQDHPNGDKRCGKCLQFQPPSSCRMVDGPVSPQGYCRIFTPLKQVLLTPPRGPVGA